MDPQPERNCHLLIGASLILLTIGIGHFVVLGTFLANFAVIVAGLFLGWIALFYCLGHATFWK